MNIRKIVLDLLNEYEILDKYVNLSLQSHKLDALNDGERAAVTALLYTTVEHKITYDYYIAYLSGRSIDKIDLPIRNALRMGLSQILHMENIPDFAAVNETVATVGERSAKSFVNGVLRRAVRERGKLPLPPREKNLARHLSVKYSFPAPLVKKLLALYGNNGTEALLHHFNTSKAMTVSVNTAKISKEEYIARLLGAGIAASLSDISEISLVLDGTYNPKMLPGFSEGLFFVQDAASCAAVIALGVSAGDTVVDTCACPGGKSFAAAVLSKDGAKIHSFNVGEAKLPLISSGAERLGLGSITVEHRDAREPAAELIGKVDKVICDAPCSGIGVIGKKPDLRYKSPESYETLPELQLEILTASAKYLKAGGELVYSTCTLNPSENEEVVDKFLLANKEFSAVDFSLGELRSENGRLTLLPHIHNTDGFFISKIRKNK